MKNRHSKRPALRSPALKARLLSATALIAAGAFVAQPVWAADYQYTTAGPHTDAITVVDGVTTRVYASDGVVARYTGDLTFQNAGEPRLTIGNGAANTGVIDFAPTVINYGVRNHGLDVRGGTLRLGNTIVRNFIDSGNVTLWLREAAALDLNGGNLALRAFLDDSSTRIINGLAGSTATLTGGVADMTILSTLADGAGTLAVRADGGSSYYMNLAGNNTYSGGTTITAGSRLGAGTSTALGSGILRFEGLGGTLSLFDGITLANDINLAPNATAVLSVGSGWSGRLNGDITSAGFTDIFKVGDGELVVGGSMYADRVFLNRGTLTSAAGADISDTASVLINANGTFNVVGSEKIHEVAGEGKVTLGNLANLTLGRDPSGGTDYASTSRNAISGGGRLIKEGGNSLTLRGANTYSGGTELRLGTLVAGTNDALGTGRLLVNAGPNFVTLGLNDGVRLNNLIDVTSGVFRVAVDTGTGTIAGRIDGRTGGDFIKTGAGTLVLTGSGSDFGGTNVHASRGILQVDGDLSANQVVVGSGGGLSGSGTVSASNVFVSDGGTLHGRANQTLSIDGELELNNASNINVALGAPDTRALFDVSGDLTLDGRLNITDAGSFGAGVYRLFDYAGALTNNTLDINTAPAGISATVQTSIANQVNIVVAGSGQTLQFWDGSNTGSNGQVEGGTGNWNSMTNWTDANGSVNSAWGGGIAVFQGNAGTVTIAPGGVSVAGLQFAVSGYTLNGGPLTLSEAQTVIRVGDGSGASMSATIDANIVGVGGLVKDDVGTTLYLAGNNSYQGNTIVRNGRLVGDTESIRNNIINNSRINFDQEQDGTFAGSITGDRVNARMVKSGLGTLRLTGLNTLNWEIYGGMLVSSTDVFQGNLDIQGNGDDGMRFEQNASGTYAGVIGGSGLLQIAASAGNVITFTADSGDFDGTTSVETGALAVNGQLGGVVNVLANGRLQGTGTLDTVFVDGTVAPGNSIGTLNIDNNITFNAGSIFEVEADPAGQSDKVVAAGTATINGGTVRVLAGAGGYAPETRYTILTAANGIAPGGAFSGVTSNFAFLTPSLAYDANNVFLTMTRNGVAFQNVGVTRNQIATGNALDSLNGGAAYNAALGLSADQARHAFDQLSGEIHASARSVMIEDSQFLRNAVNERLRNAFKGARGVATGEDGVPMPADGFGFWSQGFGSWGHIGGDGNAARLGRSIGGFFAGADAQAFDTWRFGAVAGYSRSSFDVKDRLSTGSSDNYHVGLYGGTDLGDLAVRTGAAYTWHDISMTRDVRFGGFNETLKSDYDAGTTQLFGEFAYGFDVGAARFEPFANLAYVNLDTDGFAERGGTAALNGASDDMDATFTTLGLRGSTSFDMNGAIVTAKGMVGWRHAYGDKTPTAGMRFAAGGNAFSVGGVPIAKDVAVIEAGLDFTLTQSATLGVSYAGQFGSGLSDQSFKANLNVKF